MSINERLKELGIELPEDNPPAANYISHHRSGNLVFVAGQTTKWNGKMEYSGKVGRDYNVEEAQKAARLCALNVIAHVKAACGGDLDRVVRCVRLGVFVNSTDDFSDQAQVANGASDLMVEIFGDKGRHVRSTISANALPFQTAVEVDAIFEVE